MAHIRKVTHRPRRDGSVKTSWRATWTGADGTPQSKNFDLKGEAKNWLNHVATGQIGGSTTMTLVTLAEAHLASFDALVRSGKRRAGTLDGYHSLLNSHIRPHKISRIKLSNLRAPDVQSLLDEIIQSGGSVNLARQIRRMIGTWCRFGVRRGWLMINPAQACAVEGGRDAQDKDPFVLPPKDQLTALLTAADNSPHPQRDGAIVRILMFGGLRSSELLGLADDAVSVTPRGGRLKIRERLDRVHRTLDPPKSAKGRREVPVGQGTALAVRAWRMKRGASVPFLHINARRERQRIPGRLFPDPKTGTGVWGYEDFMRECWLPLMRAADLVSMVPDSKGKNRPIPAFKPHTLRHVAVSLMLAQHPQPSMKKVQELIGHATLKMTMDTYGHLWSDDDMDDAIAQASERLIS